MTMAWSFVFGIPCVIMLFIFSAFLKPYKREGTGVVAWPALLFTTASTFAGVWGLINIKQLSKRAPFDYGYEARALLFGLAGVVCALVWVIYSRNWRSWGTLTVAAWMSLVWLMVCSTI